MSSEWNEPGTGATWRGANHLQWDDEYDESPPPSPAQDVTPSPASPPPQTTSAASFSVTPGINRDAIDHAFEASRRPVGSPFEVILRVGRHSLPVLIPLLLAGLTLLFILPLALHGQAYVHGDRLWPLILVLLALSALQGTILFYTDTNEGLWSLAVAGGFALFVVIAAFALGGPFVAIILLLLFAILCIAAVRLYLHKVPEGYVDISYAFEKPNRTLYSGINFLLPWESIGPQFQTREVVWTCPEQIIQISRDENVHLKATISYQLSPEDALLVASQYEKWEETLHDQVGVTLQTIASHLTPDDFLIWPQGSRAYQGAPGRDEVTRWERLNNMLFQQLRDKAAHWGIQVNWAQLRDVSLTPRPAYAFERDTTSKVVPPAGDPAIAQASKVERDENATEKIAEPAAQASAAPNPTPASSREIPSEKHLIQIYEQVRGEKITSPAAIRKFAAQFEAIASNPEASKTMSFDAAQAARNLYERAALIESRQSKEVPVDEAPVMARPSEKAGRPPKDENLRAGG